MEQQVRSNLRISLQLLGIIFLMLFAMAFACQDKEVGENKVRDERPTSNGSCSTKAEFLRIFTRDHLKLATTSNDIRFQIS